MEEQILRQINVVYTGQTFPLWTHGNVLAKFRVSMFQFPSGAIYSYNSAAVHPLGQKCVFMVRNTEVAVAPKVRRKNHPQPRSSTEISSVRLRTQPMKLDEAYL